MSSDYCFDIYRYDHRPLDPSDPIYNFDEDIFDMREAPPCIRSIWLSASHPQHRERWRLLSFFRGVGIGPEIARDAILGHPGWCGKFDRAAVADIVWHTHTNKSWSTFVSARCYGKPCCCRHYVRCDPANYTLALRYFYKKLEGDKWECYTFIKGKRVIVDERTRPYLEPPQGPDWSNDDDAEQIRFLRFGY